MSRRFQQQKTKDIYPKVVLAGPDDDTTTAILLADTVGCRQNPLRGYQGSRTVLLFPAGQNGHLNTKEWNVTEELNIHHNINTLVVATHACGT